MASRASKGYCQTCPTGCAIARTTNMIIGEGPESAEIADIQVTDFTAEPNTTPDELADQFSELTSPTTYSDLLRQNLTDKDIESMHQAGNFALAQLGEAAAQADCKGPTDGVCPVPEAIEISVAFSDAFAIHVFK